MTPEAFTRFQKIRGRRDGVQTSSIWAGSLKDNDVGPAIYAHFLPGALRAGIYSTAPSAMVVGNDLKSIAGGLRQLRKGISATKLAITI